MDATLRRRLAAEALGTALLVVFGPGSLVAALRLGDGELDYGGLGMVALSFGLVVALVVYGYRIRVEERALRETIGEPYLRYCASHKRLIPYVY
ncbi:MAG: hypothetical protein KY464_17955 [Gemmatimonadetes bacterium]|nr:hypothetical protein [Gemmatimonadota bacterium]